MAKGSVSARRLKSGEVVYDVSYDAPPQPGKRRAQVRFTWHGSRREAEIECARRLADAWGAGVSPDRALTVGAFLDDWLVFYARRRKPASVIAREQVVRLHIKPHLGQVKLAKLTPRMVQRWIDEQHDRGVSPAYLRNMLSCLTAALTHAVAMELLARNPAEPVEAPGPAPEPIGRSWTAEEARRFLAAERTRDDFALWVIAANAQLRRGELIGLRWEDVDATAGTIAIRRQLRRKRGGGTERADPKTATSKRTVPLAPAVMAILADHRARQAQRRATMAGYGLWTDEEDGWVFDRGDGRALVPEVVGRRFVAACRRAGVPVLRLHDLRVSGISLMGDAGIPIWVIQERAGHTDPTTTRAYSHPSLDAQRSASAKLADLLGLGGDDEVIDERPAD